MRRPFTAYSGSYLTGTEQIGNLAVGIVPFSGSYGGQTWYEGAEENNSCIIAKDALGMGVPVSQSSIGNVQFWGTGSTDEAFIGAVNGISGQSFTTTGSCTDWLRANGYWSNCGNYSLIETYATIDGRTNPLFPVNTFFDKTGSTSISLFDPSIPRLYFQSTTSSITQGELETDLDSLCYVNTSNIQSLGNKEIHLTSSLYNISGMSFLPSGGRSTFYWIDTASQNLFTIRPDVYYDPYTGTRDQLSKFSITATGSTLDYVNINLRLNAYSTFTGDSKEGKIFYTKAIESSEGVGTSRIYMHETSDLSFVTSSQSIKHSNGFRVNRFHRMGINSSNGDVIVLYSGEGGGGGLIEFDIYSKDLEPIYTQSQVLYPFSYYSTQNGTSQWNKPNIIYVEETNKYYLPVSSFATSGSYSLRSPGVLCIDADTAETNIVTGSLGGSTRSDSYPNELSGTKFIAQLQPLAYDPTRKVIWGWNQDGTFQTFPSGDVYSETNNTLFAMDVGREEIIRTVSLGTHSFAESMHVDPINDYLFIQHVNGVHTYHLQDNWPIS